MENWGLITYRLTSILYDEKESSSANKQWVAVVIAHELAHQVSGVSFNRFKAVLLYSIIIRTIRWIKS